MSLLDHLRAEIARRPDRWMSFEEYQEACLYRLGWGYYMTERPKIGREGDFVTSSHLTPLFAETFADFAAEVFARRGEPLRWCEFAPGRGEFARAFLDRLREAHPALYDAAEYLAIERGTAQRAGFEENLRPHAERVRLHEDLPGGGDGYRGIVFCNELLDNLPVRIVERRDGALREIGVTVEGEGCDGGLAEMRRPLEDREALDYLDREGLELGEGQRLEVPLAAERWMRRVGAWIDEGLWIVVDYGLTREEFAAPHRRTGTLLCFDRHRTDDRPLERPGEKDITTHVHFDALRRAARETGWRDLLLCRQNEFLMRLGLLERLRPTLQESRPGVESFQRNNAIRQLVSPGGIGGGMRVLVLARGSWIEEEYAFQAPPF